jgi:hypothetical protein
MLMLTVTACAGVGTTTTGVAKRQRTIPNIVAVLLRNASSHRLNEFSALAKGVRRHRDPPGLAICRHSRFAMSRACTRLQLMWRRTFADPIVKSTALYCCNRLNPYSSRRYRSSWRRRGVITFERDSGRRYPPAVRAFKAGLRTLPSSGLPRPRNRRRRRRRSCGRARGPAMVRGARPTTRSVPVPRHFCRHPGRG